MNVIIAGDAFGFPNGLGATARVYAYAKGFLQNGAKVKVLCLTPTEPRRGPMINTQHRGAFDGIDFEYTFGSTTRAPNFFVRRWMQLTGPLRFIQALYRDKNREVLILFSNSFIFMLTAFIGSRLLRFLYVQEKSELPFVYRRKTLCLRIYKWLFVKTMYRLPVGMIVISSFLSKYFRPLVRKHAKIIKVPILVDIQRFSSPLSVFNYPRPYIVYSGELGSSKGVDQLIRAFAIVAPQFPEVDLLVSGNNSGYANECKSLAGDLGIESRVNFLGFVQPECFPILLRSAVALVVPHRSGDFSAAAFPTKIGEYLATGKPVIATRVGEIDHFLSHGENAYLVSPGDPKAIAEAIQFILSHPEQAGEVGRRGLLAARRYFDYRERTKLLLSELEAMRGNGSGTLGV